MYEINISSPSMRNTETRAHYACWTLVVLENVICEFIRCSTTETCRIDTLCTLRWPILPGHVEVEFWLTTYKNYKVKYFWCLDDLYTYTSTGANQLVGVDISTRLCMTFACVTCVVSKLNGFGDITRERPTQSRGNMHSDKSVCTCEQATQNT